jgi:hypothetical protein
MSGENGSSPSAPIGLKGTMTNPGKSREFRGFFRLWIEIGLGRMGIEGKHGMLASFLPWPLSLGLLIAIVQPGFGHPLAQAALFDEFFLQRLQLLIQQIIGLVNQTDCNIGDHIRRASFDKLPI